MAGIMESFLDGIDTLVAWMSQGLKQTAEAYCDIQTADGPTTLVSHDGSLISVLRINGVTALVGQEEFKRIHDGALRSLESTLSRNGYSMQVHFSFNKDQVRQEIAHNYRTAEETAANLDLALDDLLSERVNHLANFCSQEAVHIVLWTKPSSLTSEQSKRAMREKTKLIKEKEIPPFRYTQNIIAAIPDLRESHESFVRSVASDLNSLGVVTNTLPVHDAVHAIRNSVDAEFTDRKWRPILPGDKIRVKVAKRFRGDVSDILWPSLAHQIMPRDGYNVDLRTCRIGDTLYSSVFIDLFPKDIQSFGALFNRVLQAGVPWRISFLVDGGGLSSLRIKRAFSSLLSFSSAQNRLINDACSLLDYIELNSDDAVVKLRVAATTWAPEDDVRLLRSRAAQLARAIQGWGSCDVSEVCGDAYAGVMSSTMGLSCNNVSTATVASLSDTIYMLPLFRPASPWKGGALMFRSPDGKLWPYQPGSSLQTTWIDLIYARPGSGKSVLSNAINLALCLSAGIERLPRIAIIDIGPSSSGLISLLAEALPKEKRHHVAYHRLRMTPEYSINPFDTQLGCRYPMPQERAFLVNLITLLSTPIGAEHPYDGVADMAGMVVDEAYKMMADDGNPNTYAVGVEEMVDGILEEIGFVTDAHTTWWEVTDALFMAGFFHEAMLAQRNAVPLLSDMTAICRLPVIEDLYGNITVPTGESLINAFTRMLSAAVREYSILSRVTQFDLGEARVVSLDLDEVAKSGGSSADRQTAVMYMLARYILAKDFYLTPENVSGLSDAYRTYHEQRVSEIREDPKRIVFDEFHRTSNAQAVRDQVVLDMREGRKWNVQIALLSQSLDDFDEVMVEFGTSVFIMDAGPEQAIKKTAKIFGLSETACNALRQHVRGPRAEGATFLAQFATKESMNNQLLTLTLGPVELWAFSTTAADAAVRNQLYQRIGPKEARRVLATLFPGGSATKYLESRLQVIKDKDGTIDDHARKGVIEELVARIVSEYKLNPSFKRLSDDA